MSFFTHFLWKDRTKEKDRGRMKDRTKQRCSSKGERFGKGQMIRQKKNNLEIFKDKYLDTWGLLLSLFDFAFMWLFTVFFFRKCFTMDLAVKFFPFFFFRAQGDRRMSTDEQSELRRSVERPKAAMDRARESGRRERTQIFEDHDGRTSDHQKWHDIIWGFPKVF